MFFGVPVGGSPGLTGGDAGDCTSEGCPLWSTRSYLEGYDVLMLSCEGDTYDPSDDAFRDGGAANKTAAGKQALSDWLDEGGSVFATHFQSTWFKNSPVPGLRGVAGWRVSTSGTESGVYRIDTSSDAGATFDAWLVAAGVATGDTISLTDVATSVSEVNAPARR